MCSVPLPPGVNPSAVNKYINVSIKIYLGKFYEEGGVRELVL